MNKAGLAPHTDGRLAKTIILISGGLLYKSN